MEAGARAPSRPWRELPGIRTALALSALALLTIVVGLIVEGTQESLGAELAPFFVRWEPLVDSAALWAVPLLVLALAAAPALLRGAPNPAAFLVGALALALAARLAVAAIRDGTEGFYAVFGPDPEGGNEYLPVLPALDSLGLGRFLDRFAELAPTLPIHPSAHPPGTILLLDALGIEGPRAFAAVTIAIGVCAVPLTWVLARRIGIDDERARIAALLIAFSPAALLYGVVSTDAMFVTLGLAAACLLVGSGVLSRILGGLALAVASFFSWALLALGAFSALVVLQRDGLRSALWMSAIAGAALVAFYGALYTATGFDPLGAVRSASEAYDLGISNARPYVYWLFGSPVAFAVALGLPTAWYAARALGAREAAAVALTAIVVVSVLVGLTKAETERIWLFMGPLAAIAAATLVPARRMPLILALLTAQAIASSILVDTIW